MHLALIVSTVSALAFSNGALAVCVLDAVPMSEIGANVRLIQNHQTRLDLQFSFGPPSADTVIRARASHYVDVISRQTLYSLELLSVRLRDVDAYDKRLADDYIKESLFKTSMDIRNWTDNYVNFSHALDSSLKDDMHILDDNIRRLMVLLGECASVQ